APAPGHPGHPAPAPGPRPPTLGTVDATSWKPRQGGAGSVFWTVVALVRVVRVMTAATPHVPDPHGRFGPYGGRYVPETLIFALRPLAAQYARAREAPEFRHHFESYLRHYVGRPSPLYFAERLTQEAGGARIFLKREDLNHTGAHKINNCIGQGLLARRMGK